MSISITEISTVALVAITALYAYLTHRMAKSSSDSVEQMKAQMEVMLRPYISVTPYVRPQTSILYLKIENSGKSVAEQMKLTMDKDFFQFGEHKRADHNLRTKPVFNEVTRTFPANAKLFFALGQGHVLFAPNADQNIVPSSFDVVVTFTWNGKTYTEVNQIDLKPYIGSEGERDALVDELEKIRKEIARKN